MTATSPPTAPPDRHVRPRRTWDLVLSIVLLVIAVAVGLLLFALAPLLAMASDSCGASSVCDSGQMGAGFLLAWFAPALVILAGVIATIVLLVLRRIAFWVPLASIVLALGVFALGVAIVVGAVRTTGG